MSSPSPKLSPDVKSLADACSVHYRTSARLWTAGATITLFVVTAYKGAPGAEDTTGVKFLGFDMDPAQLYPTCAALLAIINIAFCSSHLQAFRVMVINIDLLKSIGADSEKFSPHFSVSDAAHCLYAPTLNRMYPVTHFLPASIKDTVYRWLKVPTDWLYYAVPIFGCWYSLLHTDFRCVLLIVYGVAVLSTLMSVLLFAIGWVWAVGGYDKMITWKSFTSSQD